jgi:hypothetical protein
MGRLVRKWWGDGGGRCNSGEGLMGTSLYETGTAFLVLLTAISFSILLLTGELYFRSKGLSPSGTSLGLAGDKRQTLPSSSILNEPFHYGLNERRSEDQDRDRTHFLRYYQNLGSGAHQLQSGVTPETSAFGSFFPRNGNYKNRKTLGKPSNLLN